MSEYKIEEVKQEERALRQGGVTRIIESPTEE